MNRTLLLAFLLLFLAPPSVGAGQRTTSSSEILFEVFSVGAGIDPALVLHRVTDAAVSLDRIWILEVGRLLCFDLEGELVREIGNEGSGPGEFMFAAQVRIDSLVHVYDPQLGRETIFEPTGDVASTRPVSPGPFGIGTVVMELAGGELLIVAPRFTTHLPSHDPHLRLVIRTEEGLDTLHSIRSSGGLWRAGTSYGGFETGLGDGGGWALAGDSLLALVDGYQGRIEWRCAPFYSVCGEARIDSGRMNPEAAELSGLAQEASETAGRRLRPEDIIDYPPQRSSATSATMSDDGRWLWIQRDGDSAGGELFTVFERGGVRRGDVLFDTPVLVHAVTDQGVLLSRHGSFDETVVAWKKWRRWPVF